jgi:hypothetical protein
VQKKLEQAVTNAHVTWDLRLNSYLAIVEPQGGYLFSYLICHKRGSASLCHVMDPLGPKARHEGSRDPIVRRFYIRLGRHLLDKSFVLNSNSILIYWYSFTSNELYFQV